MPWLVCNPIWRLDLKPGWLQKELTLWHHALKDGALRIQPLGILGPANDRQVGVGQIAGYKRHLPCTHHDVVHGLHVRGAVLQGHVKPLVVHAIVRHTAPLLDSALLQRVPMNPTCGFAKPFPILPGRLWYMCTCR